MTARYPLVIDVNGRIAELPSGDSLAGGSAGGGPFGDVLNITDYGAVSGSSGAAAACAAALAALPSQGGIIYIPEGNWTWEANVAVTNSNARLILNPGAVCTRTTANPFFTVSGAYNEISGGKFNANKATVTTASAAFLITGHNNLLTGCEIYNSSDQGVALDGASTTCNYNLVDHVNVHDVDGVGISQYQATDNTIRDCVVTLSGLEGVTIDHTSHRSRVEGGYLSNCCQSGGVGAIGIDDSDLWSIEGVHIDTVGSSLAGIKTQNNEGASNYGVISGCKIITSTKGVWLHNGTSGGAAYCVLGGNIFRGNGGTAILIDSGCSFNQIGVNTYDTGSVVNNGANNGVYGVATSIPADAAIVASEAIAAGALVNLWTSSGAIKMRNANATDLTKPANGFVKSAVSSGATGAFYGPGKINDAASGLTPGTQYWLAASGGAVTSSAPSTSGNANQAVGIALSATQLLFSPTLPIEAP